METLKEELEAAARAGRAACQPGQGRSAGARRQLAKQIQAEQAKVQQQVSTEISDVKTTCQIDRPTPRSPMFPPTSAA